MRHISLFVCIFCFPIAFGQVFSSSSGNPSLSEQFKLAEDKSNEILETSYQNSSRAERINIKQTILQGSYLSDNLNRSGRVIFFGEAVEYLNDLKSKILAKYPVADSSIIVYITDDASLNAFATADNRIYVNVGLLARVNTEGQLVFILCHEIMHIINHHIIGVKEKDKTDETSISKDEILQNKEIQQLDRHLQSQIDEFEADFDGFGLFSQLDYHPSEALRTMELLETADEPILKTLPEAASFFIDNEQFTELQEDFDVKRLINKNTKKPSNESRTHPAVASRWDILDSLIEEKTITKEVDPPALFLKIKKEAAERISSILAQDFEFIGLFQHTSAKYHNGDRSDQNINALCYALQGMFVDKRKGFKSKNRFSPNRTDSLLNHFYKSSTEEELACWTYLILLKLDSEDQGSLVEPYLKSMESNIAAFDFDDFRDIVGADFIPRDKTKTTKALSFEDIEFSVSPFVDLTNKQFNLLKRREGQGNYEDGKIALLNTTAFRIRKDRMFSLTYSLDTRKGQILTNRSREAFSGIGENRDEVVCLTPNTNNYFANDYSAYQSVNNWMNEYYYFDEYHYQTYYANDLDSLREKEDIRYAFSSLSVEVKSGSGKQFILTYFSPFILPLYVPMLIVNTIVDGTRSYTLSIIVDLETKSLVLWDKRTSNEPSTSTLYYQNYDDVLNKFQASKQSKSL